MSKRITLRSLLFEQQVLGILLFSFMVIIVWVAASIYFSYSASTLTQEETTSVEALDPIIPVNGLRAIQSRKWWTPEELQSFPLSVIIDDAQSGTSVISQTNAPSQGATRSASPIATQSAVIPNTR